MNTKEVILHMGPHKTASTSIQSVLLIPDNIKILKETNLSWIDFSHFPVIDRFNNNLIVSAFTTKKSFYHIVGNFSEEYVKNLNNDILELLKNNMQNSDKLLITGESISLLKENELLDLKQFLEKHYNGKIIFKVIYFIRDPIKHIPSVYQQFVKSGYKLNLEKLKNFEKYVYYDNIIKFNNVFGEDNVFILDFKIACQHQYGIVGYFYENLGMSHENLKNLKWQNLNESMNYITLEIAEYINNIEEIITNKKLNKNRECNDLHPLRMIQGDKFNLPKDILDEVYSSIYNNLVWLKNEYGIDYTYNIDNYISTNDYTYDPRSVVHAFSNCNEFIRRHTINFFLNNNKPLANTLIDVNHIIEYNACMKYYNEQIKNKNKK